MSVCTWHTGGLAMLQHYAHHACFYRGCTHARVCECGVIGQYAPGVSGNHFCSSKSTDAYIAERFTESAHVILLIVVQEPEEQQVW